MIETLTGLVKRAARDNADALSFYKTAVQDFPQHRALVYDYAELLIDADQADKAAKLLAEQVIRHPSDITLYELLARSHAKLGNRFEQHQAQAYGYAWQGKLYAAIEQLELAKHAGGSFYQLSVVESDLRELREMAEVHGKR